MAGVDLLRRVPLFEGFQQADLERLAAATRRVSFPRGSIVFQEGDAGDFLLVLTKGRVKVTLLGENGAETIISFLEPPALLGEIALLDDSPRSATVITLEPTEFLQIARGPFLELIKRDPTLAVRMMVQLARALRKATEQVRSLAMFDVHGRLLRALLILASANQGPRPDVRLHTRGGRTGAQGAPCRGLCDRRRRRARDRGAGDSEIPGAVAGTYRRAGASPLGQSFLKSPPAPSGW
jgi:CRP/FNR family cyclic AMP-dependent transcriptional regulator